MRPRGLLAATLLLSLIASAQGPPIPKTIESMEISLVNLDVFVTNKAGERVHGLKKDDFEVFENGVAKPITNFTEYNAAATTDITTTTATQEAPTAPAQKRTIIVFVERFHLPPFRNAPFFTALRKLLHDSLRPGDRAMIVTWNRGILLTQQKLTDSLPALDHALDAVAALSLKPLANLTGETRFMVDFAGGFDAQAAALLGAPNTDGLADLAMDAVAQMEKSTQERKVRAINALIRVVAAEEGKKIMLLATHRLSRVAGAEHYFNNGRDMIALEKRAAIDMTADLKSIDETANASGVTIYPMFAEGLETTTMDSADLQPVPTASYQTLINETSALKEIAEETGGLTASGPDVTRLLPQIGEDLESYYSLAYREDSGRAGKARSVVVRAKDRSLTVRSRREAVQKSDVTRMEDRVLAALFNNAPSSGFPLNVVVGRSQPRGKHMRIPLAIHIPIFALTQLPDGRDYAGAFSVYFAWGGKLGGISDMSHETRTYAIPASGVANARATGHLTYTVQLDVDQKTETLAFGVLDEVSKEYALRLMNVQH